MQTLSIRLANGNVQTITGGSAWFLPYNLNKTGFGWFGCYIGIKSTQARTNLPVCQFIYNYQGSDYYVIPSRPYVLWASANTQGGAHYACTANSSHYLTYGPTHQANATITIFGTVMGYMDGLM